MKRVKKPKQKKYTLTAKDLLEIKQDVTETAVGTASLLYLVSMMDEFGYGYDEVEKVFVRATRYSRYLDDKVATMKDLAKTLEERTGVRVKWR